MAQQRLGIIMNGVTGRMGMNQHLIRSIVAIRAQGGVALRNGDTVMPDPILVGRNEDKIAEIAHKHGISRYTTNLGQALGNKEDVLDTVISLRRPPDYTADQGCRLEVRFTKSRGFHGPDAEPFEVSVVPAIEKLTLFSAVNPRSNRGTTAPRISTRWLRRQLPARSPDPTTVG